MATQFSTAARNAAAGAFEAEFEVTYADGGVQTFPNVGFIQARTGAGFPLP